jgi:hypothetical protein
LPLHPDLYYYKEAEPSTIAFFIQKPIFQEVLKGAFKSYIRGFFLGHDKKTSL